MTRLVAAVTAALVSAAIPCARAESFLNADLAEAERLVAEAAAETTAVSVLVRRDGEVLFERNVGLADVELSVPATAQTAYHLASVSKSLTAQATLRLIEEGRLRFETKVSDVLPDAPVSLRDLKVRDLLTHTSGLTDYVTLPVAGDLTRDFTKAEVMEAFAAAPRQFEPGARMVYSNSGYHLLGMMIEKLTGAAFDLYVQEKVLRPLGVDGVVFGDRERIIPFRASGYEQKDDALVNAPHLDSDVDFASGAYVATARSLAAYGEALMAQEKRAPKFWALMTDHTRMPDGSDLAYLPTGLLESRFEGHRKYAHAGGNPGAAAHLALFPDEGVSVVVLTNEENAIDVTRLSAKLARLALDAPKPETKDAALSADLAKRYAGVYTIAPVSWGPQQAVVRYDGGKLFIRFAASVRGSDDPEFPLLHQGAGVFLAPFDDELKITFQGSGNRRALAIAYHDAIIRARIAPAR